MTTARRLAIVMAVFVAAVLAGGEAFRGNTQTRVFHQSSCRYYTCKNCTATFASAAEAIDRGYRACGTCQPGDGESLKSNDAEHAYSGNTSTMKFHRSSCRYATCKNCTARFQSRQQAIDAGYVPGGCCDP